MLNLDTPLNTQIQQLWRWWSEEILSMVPLSLQKLLGGAREFLIIEAKKGSLELYHLTPSGESHLITLGPDQITTTERIKLLETHVELTGCRQVLRLSKTQGLYREIKLPLAAEENLQRVVEFEMDRITPFQKDQVYFSARVLSRARATRQILVKLVIVPKTILDERLSDLVDAGWQPEIVHLEGEKKPGGYNLLPDQFKPKKNATPQYLNITLTSIILSIIVLLMVLPIWSARSESLRLHAEVKKTSKIAKEVEDMREESDKMLHRAQFLQEKKQTEPVLVDALDELSRVIPDDTWLNGLQLSNHKIIIQGQSPSASSLIKQLEKSSYFKDVSFSSPVTKDSSNGLERFQIGFEVINGRFSEEPH